MKKLNRKGFTLIELLAVIVILAVVLVVTIPAVLNSMQKARQSQFQNAVRTIELYAESEYAKCNVADADIAGSYNTNLFDSDCALKTGDSADVLSKTGYTNDLKDVILTAAGDGKFQVSSINVTTNTKFRNVTVTNLR